MTTDATAETTPAPDLSIIVPVSGRADNLTEIYDAHASVIRDAGYTFEFLFIINAGWEAQAAQAEALATQHPQVRTARFRRNFGEATSLAYGLRHAKGRIICTVPAYFHVEPAELIRMVREIEGGADLVAGRRWPRQDPALNRWQTKIFSWIVAKVTQTKFQDVSCGMRAMRANVARELPLYGELHRFIPVFAQREGFYVKELDVRQSVRDAGMRVYSPTTYLRRVLDLLSLVFLARFTHKPLRFFGTLGAGVFGVGVLIDLFLSYERLSGHAALANRPALVLGTLLIVLGVQIVSVGLLGEILVYVNARPGPSVHGDVESSHTSAHQPAGLRDDDPDARSPLS